VAGRDTWVFLDGHTFIVSSPDDRPRRSRGVDHGALTAPMPATVLKIQVKTGDAVKSGDTVLLLEAMKMELPLRAPGDGIVAAVRCREGQLVQADAVLVEFR
jgi:3-methylcrotonyl-CoA carboxylase alpha subunit